jgi:hypothetical protein
VGKEKFLPAPKKEEKDKASICVPPKKGELIDQSIPESYKGELYTDYIKRCINY